MHSSAFGTAARMIDFGCIKQMPEDFYQAFFGLTREGLGRDEIFALFEKLEMLLPSDNPKEREFYGANFLEMMKLAVRPFLEPVFDFADPQYFQRIYAYGDRVSLCSFYGRGSVRTLFSTRKEPIANERTILLRL
jgi:hypothetical protein